MLVSAYDSYQRLLNYLLAQIDAGPSILYTHGPNVELGIVSISLAQSGKALLTSTSFNVMCSVYHAKCHCFLHQRSRFDFPLTNATTSVAFFLLENRQICICVLWVLLICCRDAMRPAEGAAAYV